MTDDDNQVLRLAVREILPGDRLKFQAKAAPSGTGGGARDMRFSPHDQFDDVFAKMLGYHRDVKRRRSGVSRTVRIYSGQVSVLNPAGSHQVEMIFEPPTTAKGRGKEGRVTKVHDLGLVIPPSADKRLLFLVGQMKKEGAFTTIAREEDVEDWHPQMAALLKRVLARKVGTRASRGFEDFVAKTSFAG